MTAFPGWQGWTGHAHVSERESAHTWPDGRADDARWEDCQWCSLVMFLRAWGMDIPATHAEAEALRAASGEPPTGGSNLGDARRGVLARYHVTLPDPLPDAAATRKAMVPGTVALVNGSMGSFSAGSTYRRWDPAFSGGHAAVAFRLDDRDGVWWDDPLAPTGTYQGEWMTQDNLAKFQGAWDALVAPIGARRADMLVVVTRVPLAGGPRTWRTRPGTVLSGYDPARPGSAITTRTWSAASAATATARVSVSFPGNPSPPVPHGGPFLEVKDGLYAGLLIPEARVDLDPDPATPTPGPDTTPFGQDDLDAAELAGVAKGAAQGAKATDAAWRAWWGGITEGQPEPPAP